MNERNYEELEPWEKAFHDLNMKIGNDVWGARLEADGSGGHRMRVYINKAIFEKKVFEETKGKIAGYSLVFTILDQLEYACSLYKQIEDKSSLNVEHAETSV